MSRDPYTFCVTRTGPYKVFLHAQERYRRHIQSTDATLKHFGAPRALVCTPTTRREQWRAAGAAAAAGGHRGQWRRSAPAVGWLIGRITFSGRSGGRGGLLRRRRNLRRVPTTEEKPEVLFS